MWIRQGSRRTGTGSAHSHAAARVPIARWEEMGCWSENRDEGLRPVTCPRPSLLVMGPVSRTWAVAMARAGPGVVMAGSTRLDPLQGTMEGGAEGAWWPLVAAAGVPEGNPVGRGSTPHGEMVSAPAAPPRAGSANTDQRLRGTPLGAGRLASRGRSLRSGPLASRVFLKRQSLEAWNGGTIVHFPPAMSSLAPATLPCSDGAGRRLGTASADAGPAARGAAPCAMSIKGPWRWAGREPLRPSRYASRLTGRTKGWSGASCGVGDEEPGEILQDGCSLATALHAGEDPGARRRPAAPSIGGQQPTPAPSVFDGQHPPPSPPPRTPPLPVASLLPPWTTNAHPCLPLQERVTCWSGRGGKHDECWPTERGSWVQVFRMAVGNTCWR